MVGERRPTFSHWANASSDLAQPVVSAAVYPPTRKADQSARPKFPGRI